MKSDVTFPITSPLVRECYAQEDNFLVEFTPVAVSSEDIPPVCAIYFSSHGLYYPNTEEAFRQNILKNNRFEWQRNKVPYASKHIFLRDLHKQWYLTGVNAELDTPEKLKNFLRCETKGYRVVCLGSSAGGYAAMLFGSLLDASLVISFNGQLNLNLLLDDPEKEAANPIVFANRENPGLNRYYNLDRFIENRNDFFYFHSARSAIDIQQLAGITVPINVIRFATGHHGIPFPRCCLRKLLSYSAEDFLRYKNMTFNPVAFSIRVAGIKNTVYFGLKVVWTQIKARFFSLQQFPLKSNDRVI